MHTSALFCFFSRVTMIEKLSNTSFRDILDHIQGHFANFLRLPHYKQTNLAERAINELVIQYHVLYTIYLYLLYIIR